MNRQKKYSINRNSQNKGKIHISEANQENILFDSQKQKTNDCQKCPLNENRNGLSEIVSNGNNRESIFLKVLNNENKFQPQNPPKHKENIFAKISELIKIQDIPMPICHSNKMNPLRCVRERPFTSFSHSNKIVLDQSQLNKFSVVLDLSKNQESLPPERSSTSRALMNYSKVFRNNSNDGFRVKKNMSIMNKFVHLSAQKVIFQQKQKRQKSLERTFALKKSINSKKTQERYKQQEDFEIGGWDYSLE